MQRSSSVATAINRVTKLWWQSSWRFSNQSTWVYHSARCMAKLIYSATKRNTRRLECVLEVLKQHLCYTSESLTGFDNRIKTNEKARIAAALEHNSRVGINKELALQANLEHLTINDLIWKKPRHSFLSRKWVIVFFIILQLEVKNQDLIAGNV